MQTTTTIVIGAGHAGLAMSKCLTDCSIEHIVLERGKVAHTWRTERWDSLTLLTPNWQSRLPGYGYQGDDPDGYRSLPETIAFIERYASLIAAPVQTHTNVNSVKKSEHGYLVSTDKGDWQCRSVVLASGACNLPNIPKFADDLPSTVRTLTPATYRNPEQLKKGGVLVVGAAATGIQLAQEIHLSGRPVTLSIGEHTRAPRVYRGRDIQWWLDAVGLHDERYNKVDDIVRARGVPSFQLIGTPDRETIDLNSLRKMGVKHIGPFVGINNGIGQFAGSLHNKCDLADLKMNRLLKAIDAWIAENHLEDDVEPSHRFPPTEVDSSPPLSIDFQTGEINTVLWATGFRPDYSWLHVPVFNHKGQIRHDGGIVDSPGLYLMGMQFLRRRKSALLDGAGDDARELSEHMLSYLAD
ncbi:MAG: pyridine nucleotide-disulfide oxidoreductase [Zetaproteobacteria bacterium CG_4_9_14_3_um_filter_49_83]|nr:MAG: pyridine nucleotide-disulfide oxidoreductase [Zetaproteobacteria bacterium CG1_02_49_23]PIQ34065.1 MAG: pyridine nucleotide-disulfide oxidoreductase [Zetaproteobacteria bacterium CG17_big_fil_post_rev_8_21_14_2_50_50_13]PIY55887.1 MAG: pyridine nucleotide-disulfide oxidoreductase [Zetaproteobacteria bacterium CG_4_10_14_0_8_um_filter_49_80]PJA35017.1 MAG: pyridine nucleotide-disulfide oxidoreductase [Zetaproteobacteria bacterium CG_4_9_14_3_um_filter_49_83]